MVPNVEATQLHYTRDSGRSQRGQVHFAPLWLPAGQEGKGNAEPVFSPRDIHLLEMKAIVGN
jgi:hypothetical protein